MFITGGGRRIEISPPTPLNGRLENAIVLNEDGDDLAEVMVSLGLARPDGTDGAFYEDTQADAQDAELGLWSDECDG
jgi:endonuclease YncB( thermonuclease family)